MKVKYNVTILSTRAYSFPDKETSLPVEMTEVIFRDDEGNLFKSQKKGVYTLEDGVSHDITINIRSSPDLKPVLGVIEF